MLFIKNYTQNFLTRYPGYLYFDISNKWEQKHRAPDIYYYVNNDYAVLKSLYKLIEFVTEQAEKTNSQRDKKTSFSKESVENADFY